MTGKRLALLAIYSLLLTAMLRAEEPVGEIDFIEGDVNITRDGEIMDFVDFGTEVQNLDLIRTYSDGNVSITITSASSPGTMITVSPDTVFAVEIEELGGSSKTSLNMLTGSLALKVQKLTGNHSLDVNTDTAVLGVRGTNFNVETCPSGDLLVSCNEGKVECANQSGQKLYAQPGKVVEQTPEGILSNVAVAVSDLKSFRQNWNAEKLEVFKSNALKAIKAYAKRYDEHYAKFNATYAKLVEQREIINRWIEQDKKGVTGGTMQLMRDKKALVGILFDLRAQLVIFEKIYFRLVELKGYFAEGYGQGLIEPGLSAQTFFARFSRQEKELEKKMALIRHVIKLYSLRNGGSFPADGLSGAGDDFFGGDDSFGDF